MFTSKSQTWQFYIQLVYKPHFWTNQGLVPWAINICMYCDVLWHRVLFWFHLMRYFTHQRKISKKYGPLFPRPGYGFSKWKQSYFEVVFNFLFSRATQEYCASKKEFQTSFFLKIRGTSEGSEQFQILGVYSEYFFSNHNKVILAIISLILRIWVLLKTSVASMTSTDIITSLASMSSTACFASKNRKQHALYILSDFPGIRNLSGLNDLKSLNNLSGLNDLYSLFSSKQWLTLIFPSTLAPEWPLLIS